MLTSKMIVKMVAKLPDEEFVKIANMYSAVKEKTWKIYRNDEETFNTLFFNSSPWDVAMWMDESKRKYSVHDDWLLFDIEDGLFSRDNPRKLLSYMMDEMDFMASGYLAKQLPAALTAMLDAVVKEGTAK